MSDDRPPVYWENPYFVIRASALGGCLFELVAAGQQLERMEFPENLLRAFAEGQRLEGAAISKMEEEGWRVWGSQDEYEWVIRHPTYNQEVAGPQGFAEVAIPGIKIRLHPDGLGIRNPREGVTDLVEVKWLSDQSWRAAVRHGPAYVVPEYDWQLSIMFIHLMKLGLVQRAVWVLGNKGNPPDKDTGIKPYCEDEGRIYYHYVETPPISEKQIVQKALDVIEQVLGDDIQTAGLGCTDRTHWPCLYRHLLPPDETDDPGGQPGRIQIQDRLDSEHFQTLVRRYLLHKGMVDENKTLMEEAKAALMEFAAEQADGDITKVEYIEDDTWHVPVVRGKAGDRIDWAAMPPELRRAVEKYKKPGKEYRYFRDIRRNDGEGR